MKNILFLALLSVAFASAKVVPRAEKPCDYHKPNPNNLVEGDYRVLFHKDHTLDDHFDRIGQNLSETSPSFRFLRLINGYAAHLNEQMVHELVRYDPGVRIVEHNGYRAPLEENDIVTGEPFKLEVQENTHGLAKRDWSASLTYLPWWLRMIHVGKKIDVDDPENTGTIEYYTEAGKGVNVYVFDTGIQAGSVVFYHREGQVFNFNKDANSPYTRDTWNDESGHGTHVAGILGQVAPGANIINVKVIGTDATDTDTIQALNDVTEEHNNNKASGNSDFDGSVINMSMQETDSESLKAAIQAAIDAGIPVVTSAGNSGQPQGTIPCGYPSVICVAAATKYYERWQNSNYGNGVTIVAPGENIPSGMITDLSSLIPMSGTSQASPMVAGVAAMIIGYEDLDVATMTLRMQQNGLQNALTWLKNPPTPNLLVQTGYNNPARLPYNPYWVPQDNGPEFDATMAVTADVNDDEDEGNDGLEDGPYTTITATVTDSPPIVPTVIIDVEPGLDSTAEPIDNNTDPVGKLKMPRTVTSVSTPTPHPGKTPSGKAVSTKW